MSYIQYTRHRADVSLTDQAVQQMKQVVPDLVGQSNDKFDEMIQQLDEVSRKFTHLNDMADEVTKKFEKKVKAREANHPDDVMLLQAILDHSLSEEDLKLLHSYIDHLFKQILRDIQRADSKFAFIKSIPVLHKIRARDRELSQLYDRIAKNFGISNDGGRKSHVYQLYKFYHDFNPKKETKETKEAPPEKKVSSFFFKPSNSYNFDKDEGNLITAEEKYLEIPEYENLWDTELVTYVLLKIRVSVQNRDLCDALQRCVQAVHQRNKVTNKNNMTLS